MKIIISIFLFILISFGYSQESPKGNPDVPLGISGKPKRIWAIIVGISKYQNVPSLNYADKDAISFYNYLISPAGGKANPNDVKLLLNDSASARKIVDNFDNFLDSIKENDLVYFYFSGHGDVENKTSRHKTYLLCHSCLNGRYMGGVDCLPIEDLQALADTYIEKKAKMVMIIDACKSGNLAGGEEGRNATAAELNYEWKHIIKILSCQPGENSIESDKWGNGAGVFTYFLLRGIKGLADFDDDGRISLREIGKYLDENIYKETKHVQTPQVTGNLKSIISFIDKNTYLTMLENKETNDIDYSKNIAKGINYENSMIKDTYIIKEYSKFNNCIKINKLISYQDFEKDTLNAFFIYQLLKDNDKALQIEKSMRSTLIDALHKKVLLCINNWLNNMDNTDSICLKESYKDMEVLYKLIDSTTYSFNQLKAIYLFCKSFNVKKFEEKIELLKECNSLEPESPIYNFRIANIYSENKQNDVAINYYNKATEYSKNWAWAWNNKGTVLSDMGQHQEAIICYDKATVIKPDYYSAWNNKGNAHNVLKEYDEAISCYNMAIEINPEKSDALNNKRIALLDLEKNETEKNIELSKKDKEIAVFGSWNDMNAKAIQYYNDGKYFLAMEYAEKALEQAEKEFGKENENYDFSLKNLANIYKRESANKFYTKALDNFRASYSGIDANEKLVKKIQNLASFYLSCGRYDEAEKLYSEALSVIRRVYPTSYYPEGHQYLAKTLEDLARFYQSKGEHCNNKELFKIAEELYKEVLKIYRNLYPNFLYPAGHPFILNTLLYLTIINEQLGHKDKAEKFDKEYQDMSKKLSNLEQYYDQDRPDLAIRLDNLAKGYGSSFRAEELYKKALEIRRKIYPKSQYPDGHLEIAKSIINLASYYELQGNFSKYNSYKRRLLYQEALEFYMKLYPKEKYPRGYPELSKTINKIASCYQDECDSIKALQFYDIALKINSDDYEAFNNKGILLSKLGKNEEAIKCFVQALETNPENYEIWFNMGKSTSNLKKFEEAINCFFKVIEIKPDFSDAWFQLGQINKNLFNYKDAIKCWNQVIELNPYDNAWAWYQKATTYSLLKNKYLMIKSLKKAIVLNIKNKDKAKKDEDLKFYWDDPDFKKLVE